MQPVGIVAPGRLADEGFSRRAGKHRKAERAELGEAREQLEVLFRRLAEAEARIEDDPVVRHAGAPGDRSERSKKSRHAAIGIARQRLGRAEQAGIVHGDHARAVPRRDLRRCPDRPAARGCR